MTGVLLTYYTCTGSNPLLLLTLLVSVADQPVPGRGSVQDLRSRRGVVSLKHARRSRCPTSWGLTLHVLPDPLPSLPVRLPT